MAKPQRRTLAEALGAGQGAAPILPAAAAPPAAPAPAAPETVRASLYLPKAVHRQLKELAFTHDRKMHDYLLEGLDLVFARYGMRSIAELTKRKQRDPEVME